MIRGKKYLFWLMTPGTLHSRVQSRQKRLLTRTAAYGLRCELTLSGQLETFAATSVPSVEYVVLGTSFLLLAHRHRHRSSQYAKDATLGYISRTTSPDTGSVTPSPPPR